MKKLLFFLLLLTVAAAVLLYAVPQHLIRQETAAAQADLSLLAAEPETQGKNGIDALWLLAYQTENDAERAALMKEHGAAVQKHGALSTLADRALPQPENGELKCGNSGRECLAAVRENTAQYREAVRKYAALIGNIGRLSDYDTFARRGWPNDEDNLGTIPLPPMQHLFHTAPAAALDWTEDRNGEAITQTCRGIRTGRALLTGRPGLLFPMIGAALIRQNTGLAAAMLAEQPDWANRLPQECDGVFAVPDAQQQSICPAVRDEFRSLANLYHLMEKSPLSASLSTATNLSETDLADDGETGWRKILMPVPTFNAAHATARSAGYYAPACRPAAADTLAQDRALAWPAPTHGGVKEKWACLADAQGCILADIGTPDFSTYARRMQDTAMQQRAFQAALALHRLPAERRRAALDETLAAHSTPSRKLVWQEDTRSIGFERYEKRQNGIAAEDIPVAIK